MTATFWTLPRYALGGRLLRYRAQKLGVAVFRYVEQRCVRARASRGYEIWEGRGQASKVIRQAESFGFHGHITLDYVTLIVPTHMHLHRLLRVAVLLPGTQEE